MNLPSKIVLRNFRCFPEFELELRPLTILCGPNGGGKSSLLEAVRMVGRLADGKAEGYEPAREVARRVRGLSENTWKTFGVKLYWGEEDTAEWEMEGHQLVGGIRRRNLSFNSPDVLRKLEKLRGKVNWLGAERKRFLPIVLKEAAGKEGLQEDGSGAAKKVFFSQDFAWWREQLGWLSHQVAFRGAAEAGWNRIVKVPGRSILRGRTPEELREEEFIDLASAGSGINSVLPVAVGIVLAGKKEGIFAIEEPERSLDGTMQRSLGEWVCERVMKENPPRLILETRSEILILAVQLAIAKNPELRHRVVTYWLEPDREEIGKSYGYKVTYDEFGRCSECWPPEGFGREELDLAAELLDVRDKRGCW